MGATLGQGGKLQFDPRRSAIIGLGPEPKGAKLRLSADPIQNVLEWSRKQITSWQIGGRPPGGESSGNGLGLKGERVLRLWGTA